MANTRENRNSELRQSSSSARKMARKAIELAKAALEDHQKRYGVNPTGFRESLDCLDYAKNWLG